MDTYSCAVDLGTQPFDAQVRIVRDGIQVEGNTSCLLSFADVMDMRLLNYRLRMTMREGTATIFRLGYQTEDFFEQVWSAYAKKSRDALFVDESPLMLSEGDYTFVEEEDRAHGIAKLEVFDDCVCLYPHNVGARRVPLCFAQPPKREGFTLSLALDTGESYTIGRLGRDTQGFFDRVVAAHDRSSNLWKKAYNNLLNNLEARLGEARKEYETLRSLGAEVEVGLFSPDDEGFWIVATRNNRAAVELVTSEDTATYLYSYTTSTNDFVRRLRHAMEAVRLNRRVVFVGSEELNNTPLYRMAVDRSSHLRFLRNCNVGRAIHTKAWDARLHEFLG